MDVEGTAVVERRHGHHRRQSQDLRRDQHRRQRPRLAPPGDHSGQPRQQRDAGHDPVQHPGSGPFTDRAAHAPAGRDPRHDHRRLHPARCPPNTLVQGDNAVILISLSGANIPRPTACSSTAAGSTVEGWRSAASQRHPRRGQDNDTIAGDFIGTDPTGTSPQRNTASACSSTARRATRSAARRPRRAT